MDLFPFQKEAVAKSLKFLSATGCVYNASEMGCGKSAVAITTIRQLSEFKPTNILIICPAIVTLVWEKEIRLWDRDPQNRHYTIISYDKAAKEKYNKELIKTNWDYLILDESHFIKSLEAKRTKEILTKIWPKAKYKICQSGTPMTQSIMDMWPILSRMLPEYFKDYWEFAKSYTNRVYSPFGLGYKFEGIKNHENLKKILNEKCFFRYEKAKVLKELPEKMFQQIPLGEEYKVEQDEEALEAYLELLKEAIIRNLPPPQPPVPIATMLREQGVKKAPAVIEFAKNILDTEQPTVIFYWHKDVGNALERGLKNYDPVRIEGATSQEERAIAIDNFQNGKTKLFLGQIKSSGIGITLTASWIVLFAELSFSPADISQAIDRVSRIGQTKGVMVYYFSVINSLDERIQEVLLRKSSDFKKVLAA